jgi:hypothetical protein
VRQVFLAMFCGLFVTVCTTTARADFQFTEANSGVSGNNTVSSPYANLTITGDTVTGVVTFSIDVNSNPASFGTFGFNSNVRSSDYTYKIDKWPGYLNGSPSPDWGIGTGSNISSFGYFKQIFGPSNNNNNNRLTSLTFELDFKSGMYNEAVASNFEVKNSKGNYFALEYFPNDPSTGFVGTDSLTPVPAPAAMLLGLSGLLIFGLILGMRRIRLCLAYLSRNEPYHRALS